MSLIKSSLALLDMLNGAFLQAQIVQYNYCSSNKYSSAFFPSKPIVFPRPVSEDLLDYYTSLDVNFHSGANLQKETVFYLNNENF